MGTLFFIHSLVLKKSLQPQFEIAAVLLKFFIGGGVTIKNRGRNCLSPSVVIIILQQLFPEAVYLLHQRA